MFEGTWPKENLKLIVGGRKMYVDCPKHGKHTHVISSTITGHEGAWCWICWLESLGDPLPIVEE